MSGSHGTAEGRPSAASKPVHVGVGLVVPTTGRWAWIEELLDSVITSTYPVSAVIICNQSGSAAPRSLRQVTGLEIVPSSGGISAARNDGIRILRSNVDVIGLPNDHSRLRDDTIGAVAAYFGSPNSPSIVAGTLWEPDGPRLTLPAPGTRLNRRTVWRAIEPATFISAEVGRMGFRSEIGAGSDSLWQAGEGTDLFIRAMEAGHRMVAAPEVVVLGRGERRGLTPAEQRIKLRSYARGTGYVLRLNGAGVVESAVFVMSPVWRLVVPPPSGIRQGVKVTVQSVIGRIEGRVGRCFPNGVTRLSSDALEK